MTTTNDVSTLNPGDAGYHEVSRQMSHKTAQMRRRLDWNKIAELYNQLEVGGSVLLENDQVTRISNLAVVLVSRGVKRSVDFEVARVRIGAGSLKKVAITRLSENTI